MLGNKDEWLEWDYALIEADMVIESYTMTSGVTRWEHDDEELEIQAEIFIDKFQQAVDQKTSAKNYKAVNGGRFVPKLISHRENKEFQTYEDWLKAQFELDGKMDE